ncbi:LytTR family transcriptional regulator DNA-binding domain-containing protein [Salibacterium aidingense]|uniref:LytTR family transcriptional regulator DNA-binding domain-containing protein n=1 Tax=Salibacterium aidingense TaxID=384933 RepID=UPI003BDDEAD8
MTYLKIEGVEKRYQHMDVFPPFHLTIEEPGVVAIHTSIDAQKQLLNWLSGREPLLKGNIQVGETQLTQAKRSYLPEIGVMFLFDGVYERLKVKDQLLFFKRLFQSGKSVKEVGGAVHLEDKLQSAGGALTNSERRRLQLGKLLFQNPDFFILEEPDQNVDIETKRIFLYLFQELAAEGKTVLLLTSNLENAITMADRVYRLNEKGLAAVDTKSDSDQDKDDKNRARDHDDEKEPPSLQFNKIPTKTNEKMILFDPPEIDYIESHSGQSNIYINGESFSCVFTMNELEEKLHTFGFFRCHRSYIVNLQKVREVITWTRNSYSLILDDAVQSNVPLSKNKMIELKDMLGLK